MESNIVLCGFMGCGKSTVGRLLAERLGYAFIDTDILIEQEENMTVSDIFAKKGEDYFRTVETRIAKELSSKTKLVIATGGGLMLKPENAEILNKTGLSFWIKISPETVLKRLENDTSRPLLQRDDKKVAVEELMQTREPIYADVCRYHVDGETTALEVTDSILKIIS